VQRETQDGGNITGTECITPALFLKRLKTSPKISSTRIQVRRARSLWNLQILWRSAFQCATPKLTNLNGCIDKLGKILKQHVRVVPPRWVIRTVGALLVILILVGGSSEIWFLVDLEKKP
jgi:hypothetical protein